MLITLAVIAGILPFSLFIGLGRVEKYQFSFIIRSVGFFFYTWIVVSILDYSSLNALNGWLVFAVWSCESVSWLILHGIRRSMNRIDLRNLACFAFVGALILGLYVFLGFFSLDWYIRIGAIGALIGIGRFLWPLMKQVIRSNQIEEMTLNQTHGSKPLPENEVQRRILEIVRERPGLIIKEIAKRANVSNKTASQAIEILAKEGHVCYDFSREPFKMIYPVHDQ